MDYRLLGPLEVVSHGESLPLGGPKQRAVLALLLLHANEVVATERMIDELWGDRPPKSVEAYIQNCISRLRKTLGRDAIERRPPGYVLSVDPDSIDVVRFERAVEAAAALDPAGRAAALREAIALWHGAPLADFAYEEFAQGEIARLDDLRVAALEQRLEAELALGRHDAVLGEIEALVRRHPSRERLRELQMLALYRAGRQRDALRAYQEARLQLLEEHGLEPAGELRSLERMIITHDPALQLHPVVAARASPEPSRAAVVLALEATGVDDSADFLAALALAVEHHEGTIRASDTEGSVVLFGTPVAHDDDTLRALRAAHEIRAAAADGIEVRAAIERSEDAAAAVDLLAAAAAGDVLLGPGALQLVPAAVDVVPHEGGGYRVLRFDPNAEPIARRLHAPLVGRADELAQLEAAFDAVATGVTPRRVVLVGDAGIGKTRVARELVERVEPRATVVAGRCTPYGDAAALLPLHQILDQIGPLDTALGCAADADVVISRLHDRSFADRSDAFWALRRLLETTAARKPLLVVLEDVHWAAPVLLDLVEYLTGWAAAPLLVLCLSRPELLDTRPAWRDAALVLQPLPREDAEALVAALPSGPVDMSEAVEAGEGNPLFLEQLVAFAAEEGDSLPPTLDVLIRSRIDRLPDDERAVLERASVAGRHFWRSTVEAAFDDNARAGVGTALMALMRRRLVDPEQASVAGEDGFRFHHALIRDSVYAGLDEATRGRLHESVARALDERGAEDEVVGHHLEQAARVDAALSAEAGARLGAAGVRAMRRIDTHDATPLLTRALALLPASGSRLALECALGTALKFEGQTTTAKAMLDDVAARAAHAGDDHVAHLAQLEGLWWKLAEGELTPEEGLGLTVRAAELFAAADDDFACGRALHLQAAIRGVYQLRYDELAAVAARIVRHYARAGVPRGSALTVLAVAAYRGSTPVPDAVEQCRTLLGEAETPVWASFILPPLAALEAMRGDFDEARARLAEARDGRQEFSDHATLATSWAAYAAEVELLAGDPQRAEHILEASRTALIQAGEREWLATNSALLADALNRQSRSAEALAAADFALGRAPPGHLTSRTVAGRSRAVALARLGRLAEARSVVSETLELQSESDVLDELAAAHLAAAEVHSGAGMAVEAEEHQRLAVAQFERKGNVVSAKAACRHVATASGGEPLGTPLLLG